VGKTIQSIDSGCVNVLKLKFTDGTELELWAETAISTNAGDIPGIYVDVPKPKSVPPPLPKMRKDKHGRVEILDKKGKVIGRQG
jgi:hypothetical protein